MVRSEVRSKVASSFARRRLDDISVCRADPRNAKDRQQCAGNHAIQHYVWMGAHTGNPWRNNKLNAQRSTEPTQPLFIGEKCQKSDKHNHNANDPFVGGPFSALQGGLLHRTSSILISYRHGPLLLP